MWVSIILLQSSSANTTYTQTMMRAPTPLLAPEGGGLEAAARLLGALFCKLAVVERVQRAQLVVQRQVLCGAHLAWHKHLFHLQVSAVSRQH